MSAESPDWPRNNPEFASRAALDAPRSTRDRVAGPRQIGLNRKFSRLRPLLLRRSRGVWAGYGSKAHSPTECAKQGSGHACAGSR